MANDVQYLVKLHYSEAVEENLHRTVTSQEFAEMVDIPNGVTKKIPHIKMRSTGDYVKYTDQVIKDIDTGNDDLTINTTPMVNFALDDIDVQDDYINVKPEVISDATYAIKSRIDGDFFAQVLNAKWKYDNNGFGLNTGTLTPVALTTGASQNISTVFGMAKAGLVDSGCNGDKLKLAVDAFTTVNLTTLGLEAGFNIADLSFTRGFKGNFGGMSTYEVSNLSYSTILDLATNPTDGDYIIIKGVKFTFLGTVGASPMNIHIGSAADDSAVNLINCIMNLAGGTPGTDYVAMDDETAARLEGVTAVDGTDLITFTSKRGALMASSSMTAAANDFQAQAINCAIMEKGAIKMALRGVKTESAREPKKLVWNYFIYARYGLKVTTRGTEKMCRLCIQSKAAEA